MKNESEESAFKQMQTQFWRSELKSCSTPEQALAKLENEAGLDTGRAIREMRFHRPDLYIRWRKEPPQFKPTRNPGMERFRFIG